MKTNQNILYMKFLICIRLCWNFRLWINLFQVNIDKKDWWAPIYWAFTMFQTVKVLDIDFLHGWRWYQIAKTLYYIGISLYIFLILKFHSWQKKKKRILAYAQDLSQKLFSSYSDSLSQLPCSRRLKAKHLDTKRNTQDKALPRRQSC